MMLKTIEGVYHTGEPKSIDLQSRGLDARQIRELRARFSTIADDWDEPEMSLYDNYDTAKAN